jgi:rhodanese-related sulfurtransferase
VLDVREPWEWKGASIKADGFHLMYIAMGEVPARLAELPKATPIACLCHHGARSQRVATYLEQQGLGPVANIAGGINAWSNELDASVPRY